MSSLADRIRGIVRTETRAVGAELARPDTATNETTGSNRATEEGSHLERILAGEWRDSADGRSFVVERRIDPQTPYGHSSVGDLAGRVQDAADAAPVIAGGAPARPPFVFLDLETTGLSGGAGTYAFLVGCGSFDDGGAFVTRQYVMTRFSDERPLLGAVAVELARAGALISFNGKSFDAPVLETRYLFHRLEWVGARIPHLDVLHPARRFWGHVRAEQAPPLHRTVGLPARHRTAAAESLYPTVGTGPLHRVVGAELARPDCSLLALERQVLGARRAGDVPGFEIPARYFQFVRSGDARPLVAVLEHNRRDLLSMAGLAGRLLHLARSGAAAARDAGEALALGRTYARAGLDARACEAYAAAAGHSGAGITGALIRIEAFRALALVLRRGRRYELAAEYWRHLLDVPGCPRHLACEATEALAIHHEHRLRDLVAAKTFALRSLENGHRPSWTDAVRHRLNRIDRKLQRLESRVSGRKLPENLNLRLES